MISKKSSNYSISEALQHATDLFLALSFVHISRRLFGEYQAGGNAWKQGDWLINNAGGDVRRGHFGSAIIYISDIVGSDLLLTVVIMQFLALLTLFICFRLLVASIGNSSISVLLLISSALFTVFWIADPQGSMRKELITFAGLSMCALATTRNSWLLLWPGVILVCISFLSHEAMVLFAPLFFGIIIFSGIFNSNPKHAIAACAMVFLSACYSVYFSVTNAQVPDVSLVCLPLLERGLDQSICSGSIRSLGYDGAQGFQHVISIISPQTLGGFLIAYAIALAPLVYIINATGRPLAGLIVLIATALPFVPLYVIAIDWGRWMSFHIFSAAILIACATGNRKFDIVGRLSDIHVLVLVTISLLISPSHVIGVLWGGAFLVFASFIARLLS